MIEQNEPGPFSAKIIGPFPSESRMTINGFLVPNMTVGTISGGPNDGLFCLHLDDRWEIQCTQDELDKWGWFMANAMAVAAGMTCHGEGSKPRNPHAQKCSEWY